MRDSLRWQDTDCASVVMIEMRLTKRDHTHIEQFTVELSTECPPVGYPLLIFIRSPDIPDDLSQPQLLDSQFSCQTDDILLSECYFVPDREADSQQHREDLDLGGQAWEGRTEFGEVGQEGVGRSGEMIHDVEGRSNYERGPTRL